MNSRFIRVVCKAPYPLPWWSHVIVTHSRMRICGEGHSIDCISWSWTFFFWFEKDLFQLLVIYIIPLNFDSVCKAGVGPTLTYDTYIKSRADVWRIILPTSKFIRKSNSRTSNYSIIFLLNFNIAYYKCLFITYICTFLFIYLHFTVLYIIVTKNYW